MAKVLTFTDRVVGFFSPSAARRRAVDRLALEALERGYDGAAKGRHTAGWRTSGSSADSEILASAQILRDRMRDLVRNNPVAAQAVQVLVNNMIGAGIRPRAVVRRQNGTRDKAAQDRINALFEAWSKTCDARGRADFYGLQTLALREMIEGGDVFAIKHPRRRRSGMVVPLQIELREADHLDALKYGTPDNGARILHGIEVAETGERLAYWLFPNHPGDTSPSAWRTLESQRVSADRVVHLFESQRVQLRGVPWGAPSMLALRHIDDWQHADLIRKKTEAALVGVVLTEDSDGPYIGTASGESEGGAGMVDAYGNPVEEMTPGMFLTARGGRDVKFSQPTSTGGVAEWHRTHLHLVASGFRVPYALMTGDLSQANFSSSRIGLNEFRRMIEALQWQLIIPVFCQPIWDWFVDHARLAGEIPERWNVSVEWAPPGFESVNPWQDAQTDIALVRALMKSPQEVIASRGFDPTQVLEDQIEWAQMVDAAKLKSDADARHVAKAGTAQTGFDAQETAPPTGQNNQE